MLRRFFLGLVTFFLLSCSILDAQVPAFGKGERVCFLGDSIFHGGKVHANLLLFYATRYPESPMLFHNAGVAGDTAKEAQRRLDWDVHPYRPNITVMMFGMNDVARWLYGPGKDEAKLVGPRQARIDENRQATQQLISLLKSSGSQVILCTPTPYDQYSQRNTSSETGVDDALAKVAANVRQLAQEENLPLVDFHAQMLKVLHAQQASEPAFSMMDPARIHPDGPGHLLMTYLVLKAQKLSPLVSKLSLDAQSGQVLEAANCTASDVSKESNSTTFTLLAKSLPYPVAASDSAALNWIPWMQDLNQEQLAVQHLAPGEYELLIDGQSVGIWPAESLGKGINLADNPRTPQYQQAAKVLALSEKRHSRDVNTLRIFAALEHDVLRPQKIDLTNMEDVRSAMDKAIAAEEKAKSWRHNYFINLSKVYYVQKPKQQQIEKELDDLAFQMFAMAKPVPHRYEIRAKAK